MDNLEQAIERLEIIKRKEAIMKRLAQENGLDWDMLKLESHSNNIIQTNVNSCLKELILLKERFKWAVRNRTDQKGCLVQEDGPNQYYWLNEIWSDDFDIKKSIKQDLERISENLDREKTRIAIKKDSVDKAFSDLDELAEKAQDWKLDEDMNPNHDLYLGNGVRYKPPRQRFESCEGKDPLADLEEIKTEEKVQGVSIAQWVEIIHEKI